MMTMDAKFDGFALRNARTNGRTDRHTGYQDAGLGKRRQALVGAGKSDLNSPRDRRW